jgi:hypothetical protein
VPLKFQRIAKSKEGSVIDESSMAGCVRNRAEKSPAMELSSQENQITAFVENNNLFL